jgi:hypothetical protein
MTWLFCHVMVAPLAVVGSEAITSQQLASSGVPSGVAREVLPGNGALLHLQVHDILSVLEGVEEIVVAGVPEKALPPDAQQLFQTEHPLLMLLGMQTLQAPITPELFEDRTGVDPRGSVTLTLYLGDPRRMFIVSIPSSRARDSLVPLMNAALRPSRVEQTDLGQSRKALRVVSEQLKVVPELFVVSSDDVVYLCGDRALAIALHDTPTAHRFGQDALMSRELPEQEDRQLRLVLNPTSLKPLAMQLQGLRGVAGLVIQQQRQKLLEAMPREAKDQIEMQFRTQFGVRDLDEFADYAEAMVVATLEQVLDGITGGLVAFEGLTVTSDLNDGFQRFSVKLHSNKLQESNATAAIPMNDVKKALAWLGPDFQSFEITGKQPAPKDCPVFANWTQRVREQFKSRGLESAGFDRLAKLLAEQAPVPTVESQVPWTLTAYAPLRPLPSIKDAPTLEAYFYALELPVRRAVKIVPGRDLALLEKSFRTETERLNRNRELSLEFVNSFQTQRPLFDQVNRFESASMDKGISQYIRESAFITRGGLFGYDQHELVSRKIVWARQVGDYLVYYHGAKPSPWLADLTRNSNPRLAPGVERLLDRVPDGSGRVSVHRVMAGLGTVVKWLDELELRLHADARNYLDKAQKIAAESPDLETARQKIRGLKMPELIGSVNVDPATKTVYGLLPAGQAAIVLPRPRVMPLLSEALADYNAKANDVGGSVAYSKTGSGTWEFTVAQSWESLTTFTRTFGNALFEQHLSSPEKQRQLEQQLTARRDGDPAVFDEVVARNPRWAFLPQPQPRTDAKPGIPIPARDAAADNCLVDLGPYYNAALNESWHQGGMANNTLKDLPTGIQQFADVKFDVRGIVQLAGQQAARELRVRFPQEIDGIRVGRSGTKLHLLHACGWASPKGTKVGSYVVHYANGQTREIPIVYGQDVQDWWLSEPIGADNKPAVAWQGSNHAAPNGPPVAVYLTTWANPLPEVNIESIDYRSAMQNSAPFLLAVTVEP